MEIFPNWTTIPIVFFLIILTFILNRLFFRPLGKILAERDRKITGAKKEAANRARWKVGRKGYSHQPLTRMARSSITDAPITEAIFHAPPLPSECGEGSRGKG